MLGTRKRAYRASLVSIQRFHFPSGAGGLGDLSPSIGQACDEIEGEEFKLYLNYPLCCKVHVATFWGFIPQRLMRA